MRINSVTPVRNKFNFGYNAQFEKQIIKQLYKSKDSRAKLVIDNEKRLMKIEDDIVKLEKRHLEDSQEYRDMTEYLIQNKAVNSYFIEMIDDDLKCCDNQISFYLDEFKKAETQEAQSWRIELCRYLNSYSIIDYFPEDLAPIDAKPQSETATKENLQNKVVNTIAKAAKSTPEEELDSLMAQYVRNEFSPSCLNDVVGSEQIKERLNDDLIYYTQSPLQAQQDYHDYGIRAPRGFLFYGPPGCGKTYMTQALVNETGMKMYMMDVSKIGSMYVNQTSKNIRGAFERVFNIANTSQKPVIIFMDEVDALALNRTNSISSSGENSKTTATLLKMIEAARDNNTIVIACTNRYDMLDQAFKDRFDGQIYFPLPDEKQIRNLLSVSLLSREKGEMLGSDDSALDELTKLLKGYSNRSIMILLDDASKLARRRSRDNITLDDVKTAIKNTELEKPNEREYLKLSDRTRSIGF